MSGLHNAIRRTGRHQRWLASLQIGATHPYGSPTSKRSDGETPCLLEDCDETAPDGKKYCTTVHKNRAANRRHRALKRAERST